MRTCKPISVALYVVVSVVLLVLVVLVKLLSFLPIPAKSLHEERLHWQITSEAVTALRWSGQYTLRARASMATEIHACIYRTTTAELPIPIPIYASLASRYIAVLLLAAASTVSCLSCLVVLRILYAVLPLVSLSSDISRLVRRRFLSVGSVECGPVARRCQCCDGNLGKSAAKTAAVVACRVVVGATSASQLPPSPPPLRPFRRSNSSQGTTSVSEDGWQFSVLALQTAQLFRLVVLG